MERSLVVVIALVLSTCHAIHAQYVQLRVPLYGQKTERWCWSASIQMVANYYHPNTPITQCDIASRFYALGVSGSSPHSSCTQVCTDTCPNFPSTCQQTFNSSLPLYYGGYALEFPYFQLLFNHFGFRSFEDHRKLSWKDIENEINNCRPIIINVGVSEAPGATPGKGVNGDHVIVGKGYYILNPGDEYIIINDPWEQCTGCTYLLNFQSLVLAQSQSQCNKLSVDSMISTIHHIEPNEEECEVCKKVPPPIVKPVENSLAYKVARHKDRFAGTRFGSTMNANKFYSYIRESPRNHHLNDVYYLSQTKLLNTKISQNSSINDVSTGGKIQMVIYKSENVVLAAEMSVLDSCIRSDKITDCMVYAEDPVESYLAGKRKILSNNPEHLINSEVIPYAIVKFIETGSVFARFSYEGKIYWQGISGENGKIFTGQKPMYQTAFEESSSLKYLQQYVKLTTSKKLEVIKQTASKKLQTVKQDLNAVKKATLFKPNKIQ